MQSSLSRRLFAEALGSFILTGAVVGSGILAVRLSSGNDAVALIGNTAATAAILYVLITALGPISGAHFNPAVTLIMALKRSISIPAALLYVPIQIVGCVLGAWLAHLMFEEPILQFSSHARAGAAQILSEGVATFALVFCILGVSRMKPQAVPAAVALVITAGYWWTASTSFANPAITIARSLTDSFAGIRPVDAPGFVVGQFFGAIAAWLCCGMLFPKDEATCARPSQL
jgi:glycerol uptake facilitator-like aquaporin